MAKVGVRELRANIAVFLRRAGNGEHVVITVDGQPVATLGPVAGDPMGLTLDDLVARGAVEAPRRRGDLVPSEPVAIWSGMRVDRAVREVRT